MAIRTFADPDTARLFARQFVARFQAFEHTARKRLRELHAAAELRDLARFGVEKLTGDRAGCHSIRINKQWRVCFRWRNGDAYAVEIVDYH
ncbi:MAG: type II toxin-antitoxin system RelE/ParE family toxin [Candidatus Binataceae bacterium]